MSMHNTLAANNQLSRLAHLLGKVIYPVTRIANDIGSIGLTVMMILTTADVVLRYFFSQPIKGSFELTELMLPIVIALGLAYTAMHKEHIRVEIFFPRFTPRVRAFADAIDCLAGIVIFLLIIWQSILYAESLRAGGDTTAQLFIPLWPFPLIIAFGTVLFSLIVVIDLFYALAQLFKGEQWWGKASFFLGIIIFLLIIIIPPMVLTRQMSAVVGGVVGLCLLLVLLFMGINIGATMALVGFLGLVVVDGLNSGLVIMKTTPYATCASYSFAIIPLFLLMGTLCSYSGLGSELFSAAYKWLGRLPGGLAMAVVGGCAAFACVCGSSLATTATMATVALPEMKKYNYDSALATGVIAAAGPIGILIPPSTILVIYGIITEESIGKLLLGGFIPGIMQALFYIITIYIICKRNPHLGPLGPRFDFKEKLTSLTGIWQVVALFVLVIGGIYSGIFSPTEAAGLGAFGALFIAICRGKLKWQSFRIAIEEAGKSTAMIFYTLIGAIILGYFITITRLPFEFADLVTSLSFNRYVVYGFILLILLFLGCIMSSLVVVLLTVPIFFPVIVSLGFDPIWFGIIITVMTEIAETTPPIGISVFITHGIAKDVPMSTVFRGIVPFLMANFVFIALLTAFPEIVTFLPNLMK